MCEQRLGLGGLSAEPLLQEAMSLGGMSRCLTPRQGRRSHV